MQIINSQLHNSSFIPDRAGAGKVAKELEDAQAQVMCRDPKGQTLFPEWDPRSNDTVVQALHTRSSSIPDFR